MTARPARRRRHSILVLAVVCAGFAMAAHIGTWTRSYPGWTSTSVMPQSSIVAFGWGRAGITVGSNSAGGIQTLGPQLNHPALSFALFQFNDPNTKLYVLKDATLPPPQRVALVLDGHCVAAAARLPGVLVPMISVHAGALWALAAMLVAIRLWLLRRDVRRTQGSCRACGYERAGLAEDSPCPECGAGAPQA